MNLRSSAAIIHLSVLVYHYERVSRGSYIFLASINSLRICIIYVTHIRARVAPAVSRLTTLDYEIVRESPRSRENLIINSKEIRLFCSYFPLSFSLSLSFFFSSFISFYRSASLFVSLFFFLFLSFSLSLQLSFSLKPVYSYSPLCTFVYFLPAVYTSRNGGWHFKTLNNRSRMISPRKERNSRPKVSYRFCRLYYISQCCLDVSFFFLLPSCVASAQMNS